MKGIHLHDWLITSGISSQTFIIPLQTQTRFNVKPNTTKNRNSSFINRFGSFQNDLVFFGNKIEIKNKIITTFNENLLIFMTSKQIQRPNNDKIFMNSMELTQIDNQDGGIFKVDIQNGFHLRRFTTSQ